MSKFPTLPFCLLFRGSGVRSIPKTWWSLPTYLHSRGQVGGIAHFYKNKMAWIVWFCFNNRFYFILSKIISINFLSVSLLWYTIVCYTPVTLFCRVGNWLFRSSLFRSLLFRSKSLSLKSKLLFNKEWREWFARLLRANHTFALSLSKNERFGWKQL